MTPLSFDELVERYNEGQASAAEVEYLSDQLRSNSDLRRRFTKLMNLDCALASLAAGGAISADAEQIPPAPARPGPSRIRSRWYGLGAILSLVLLFAIAANWAAPSPFAVVESGVGVEGLEKGKAIGGEWRTINAGTLSLMTSRKARVVIEAPAKFRFESAQCLHLSRGRLAADVPPSATRFTVITPFGNAVDLGTQFGVDVPQQGGAEIHVFQGEVVAESGNEWKNKNLYHGDAIQLKSRDHALRTLRSGAFIQPDEVHSLHAALVAGQEEVSTLKLVQLRADPSIISVLDFELGAPLDGRFQMVQGRWPGSSALEFVNVGDHFNLKVGEGTAWPQLTLAAWVRLDRLTEPYQSLLHTDGWLESQPGTIHWMVTNDKLLRLGTKGNRDVSRQLGFQHEANSRPSALLDSGRWIHLALGYDSHQKFARLYLNGRLSNEVRFEEAHPAVLGSAQIGNWNSEDRRLSGRIDEMVMLGRTMSDQEIKELYDAGNPYR